VSPGAAPCRTGRRATGGGEVLARNLHPVRQHTCTLRRLVNFHILPARFGTDVDTGHAAPAGCRSTISDDAGRHGGSTSTVSTSASARIMFGSGADARGPPVQSTTDPLARAALSRCVVREAGGLYRILTRSLRSEPGVGQPRGSWHAGGGRTRRAPATSWTHATSWSHTCE
jgi:hypothetical protein